MRKVYENLERFYVDDEGIGVLVDVVRKEGYYHATARLEGKDWVCANAYDDNKDIAIEKAADNVLSMINHPKHR